MQRLKWRGWSSVVLVMCACGGAWAQSSGSGLTWEQIKAKFLAANPNLKAGELNIQESKAQEITAYLRPNPDFTATLDQLDPFSANPYRPFGNTLPLFSFSYLHERQHKRELRLESAQAGTAIAATQLQDLERTLLFNLRGAFVQTLEAKALLANAKENLDYFAKQVGINRDRFKAGDIARVDLDRVLLQKSQYEADYQNAQVNMRTAKITLLMLLNERTPVDKFDVTGPFQFSDNLMPLEAFHSEALATRPDLKSAMLAVKKAQTDHKLAVANGSTDPTFGVDLGRNPPIPVYMGVNVTIPLRIFDRNQGEKARTQVDIIHAERQRDAAEAQVFSDVDSAYFTLVATLNQLREYAGADGYLQSSARIRETISFSFQHGEAALLDYLDAQRDYRATQVQYLSLIGSYLTAAGQLNLAVGREVMQ
ncbi:MAG TPA: TolC family protein [Candidatus Sulfopaludibacter sp.]|jgi:cobalt-zinc-cadmium efflux system outer membrane protein|nr:TolC family protein [Candidatus Sulfopaludibacter sp.]